MSSNSSSCKDDTVKDEESNYWKIVGSTSRRSSVVVQEHHSKDESSWGSFGGFQWEGPSIFEEEVTKTESSFDPMSMLPTDPLFRHQRSYSFSMGQEPTFFGYEDSYNRNSILFAPTLVEEEEEGIGFDMPHNSRLHRSMDDAYFRSNTTTTTTFGLYSPSSTNSSSSSYWTTRRSSLGFNPTSPTTVIPSQKEIMTIPHYAPTINPTTSMQQLTELIEKTHLSTRMTEPLASMDEGGKGISLQKLPPHILLYMVEFKSGRTDFYYVSDMTMIQLQKGDLVIVEADRGKDLGKVATDTLTVNQVLLLKQQQQTSNSNRLILDEEYDNTTKRADNTFIKKIYRKALPDEISLLLIKEQDEQKALNICLQKIKNRKLQMEVVDAEFQWDRRKLTFYFISEKRIDFRELVRELFKIYKTRIWMCAVIPTIPVKSVT